MKLRSLTAAALGLAVLVAGAPDAAQAQTYPNRPVRWVLGFAAGGVADITARIVAPKLGEALGQTVVVDNRPSAGGIVAADAVAKAEPDGHTILLITGGNAVSSSLYKSLSYDPLNDFAMVSTVGFFDLVILVDPSSSARSLKDLVAAAKAAPGKLNLGTVAIGSTQHLAAEYFRSLAGVDMVIVNYRTTPAVMGALNGNEIQAAVEFIAPVTGQIKGGATRALAATASKRSAILPDVPTVAESGLPGFEVTSWNGIAVPARTPQPVIDRLNREIARVLADKDIQERLLAVGVEARSSSSEWLKTFFLSESRKWSKVIADAKIERQ